MKGEGMRKKDTKKKPRVGKVFKLARPIGCKTHAKVVKTGGLHVGSQYGDPYYYFAPSYFLTWKTFRQLADACPKRKPRRKPR